MREERKHTSVTRGARRYQASDSLSIICDDCEEEVDSVCVCTSKCAVREIPFFPCMISRSQSSHSNLPSLSPPTPENNCYCCSSPRSPLSGCDSLRSHVSTRSFGREKSLLFSLIVDGISLASQLFLLRMLNSPSHCTHIVVTGRFTVALLRLVPPPPAASSHRCFPFVCLIGAAHCSQLHAVSGGCRGRSRNR